MLVIAGVGLGAIGNEWRQSERRSPTAASRGTRDTSAMQGLPTSSLREAREAAYAARIAVHEIAVNLQRTARSTRLALQQATRSVAIAVRAAVRPNAIPHSLPYRPSTSPNSAVDPGFVGSVHARCGRPPGAEHTQGRYRHQPDVVRRLEAARRPSAGRTMARSSRSASTGSSSSQTMISTSSGCRQMARSASPTAAGSPVTPSSSRRTRSGTIERHYRDGSGERPFEPEGRQWLARVLPGFIRQSGIGAPARVARILKQGGPAAVLREISLIDGAYAKRVVLHRVDEGAGPGRRDPGRSPDSGRTRD